MIQRGRTDHGLGGGRFGLMALVLSPLLLVTPLPAWSQTPAAAATPIQAAPSLPIRAVPADTGIDLEITLPRPARLDWSHQDGEVVLRASVPLGDGDVDTLPAAAPEWLTAAARGYDSLLLVLARPAQVRVSTDGAVVTVRLRPDPAAPPVAPTAAAEPAPTPEDALADALLRARVYIDTGRLAEARRLLLGLLPDHADSTDVAALLASVEELAGRPLRALHLNNRAIALRDEPDPGALRNKQRLERLLRPTLSTGVQIVDVRNGDIQHQYNSSLSPLQIGDITLDLTAESRFVASNSFVNRRGVAIPYRERLDRLTAEASTPLEIGGLSGMTTGVLVLDGVRDGPLGIGLGLDRRFSASQLALRAYYHQPLWDSLDGLAQGGTRDRLSAVWQKPVAERLTLTLGGNASNYGLRDDDNLVQTVGVQAGLSYQMPLPVGQLSLDYGMDGEYVAEAEKRRDAFDNPYRPLGVITREVHSVLATWNVDWRGMANAALFAGYSLDRYNADGPQFGTRLTVPVGSNLAVSGGAQRSMVDSRGAGRATDTVLLTLTAQF